MGLADHPGIHEITNTPITAITDEPPYLGAITCRLTLQLSKGSPLSLRPPPVP